ncbi:MAG TPA: hypothetical protein VES64_07015 [Allosphingosinicella sp.]|nr:hypothetical protein [Allosphingosinicella sp.]
MRRSVYLVLIAAGGLAACAYDEHGDHGREWAGQRHAHGGALSGPGVAILDDWLKDTREGKVIVTMGWRDAGRGVVSEDVAHRANIWFRRYADGNRDMTITDAEIRAALVAGARRWTRRARASEGPGN